MPSLYEHAGGDEGLRRLEEVFYNKLLTDPLLKPLFPVRRKNHVRHLMWFTAESFGGPDRFTRELGFAYIVGEHRHLNITDEQRQRFVELYMESLDAAGLPADKAFREDFRSHAEFGAKVAQINSHAETDAELHPLSQVPHWTWDGDD